MDKGAHFYRCDFQVHSPRDRHWEGDTADTDEERKTYARELIAACREKELHAIAITDHHDLAFVDTIRREAAYETDSAGAVLPETERLVVFPGMELTLGIPCQALLIFDADFPADLFAHARTALSLQPYADDSPRGPQVARLSNITDLRDLYDKLNSHEVLRHRFIVFPNVSERGTSTLLRAGHAGHYANMPCIGGYLDGSFDQLGDGNTRILNGADTMYGRKALAIFQTSDNRKRSHADLGQHSTWVKWAIPTSEALRQACLAKQSRISQQRPFVPSIALTSVTVSQSKFLGPLYVELNPQYNALIGGRGTGKSTILEYIRWALFDEPVRIIDDLEATDYRKKRVKLVENTLLAMNADVTVDFLVNGVRHSVRRLTTQSNPLLQIGDANYEAATEEHIRALLPVQAYSQKQLSSVSVRVDELKRLIAAPIRQQLEDIATEFSDLTKSIRSTYGTVARRRQAQRDQQRIRRELSSLEQQISTTRLSLRGLSEEDQGLLARKPLYDVEDAIFRSWREEIKLITGYTNELIERVKQLPSQLPDNHESLPNAVVVAETFAHLDSLFQLFGNDLERFEQNITNESLEDGVFATRDKNRSKSREAFLVAYNEAQGRSTAHQSLIKQLADLEERAAVVRERSAQVSRTINETATAENEFNKHIDAWKSLHQRRAVLIGAQAENLTNLSGGMIRARLQINVGTDAILEKLRSLIVGTGIRTQKVEDLAAGVSAAASPIESWFEILAELELLAYLEPEEGDASVVVHTQRLKQVFTGGSDIQKLAAKITADNWSDLVTAQLEDEPIFEYQARPNDYKPFADTSAGQQATALLTALLNQEGPPLIIDQPEDDLDVGSTPEIIERIWKAKHRRQLIFASHNANLVVNGDAELVICCDYRVPGQQATGQIKCEGAIDMPEVRTEITRVMEGGEAAFKLRMEKYGF